MSQAGKGDLRESTEPRPVPEGEWDGVSPQARLRALLNEQPRPQPPWPVRLYQIVFEGGAR